METPIITFTTAWYDLGAKFAKEQYYAWAQSFLQNVRKFNLIVYVEDDTASQFIWKLSNKNPRIYIITHPFNEFPLYVHQAKLFEENHKRNTELNRRVSWKLVLLWCSKQYLVEKTELNIAKGDGEYPGEITEYYGWVDIGYFRSRNGKLGELSPEQICHFPNTNKIKRLERNKIHYALVNPPIIDILKPYVQNRNNNGLPVVPYTVNQISIAGGFFILGGGGASTIWREQFESHLLKYLNGGNNYVVKDDQYVIIDLIILNPKVFELWIEPAQNNVDSWFLFQRLLM